MKAWRTPFLQAVAFALLLARVGHAADDQDGKAAISLAFEKSKDASTVEDLTEIIRLCETGRNAELSEQMAAYVPKLLAWTHNRRGEARARRAAEAIDEGLVKQASEFDEQALHDFTRAVELDPGRPKPLHNRGVSHAVRGAHDAAVADFSQVIELDPNHLDARFNRAEVLSEMQRHEEALADYEAALELRPDDLTALLGRGRARARLGRHNEALADCQTLLDSAGDTPAAYVLRGDIRRDRGKWAEAAADYRHAIELDQTSELAYRHAAWLMATCPVERFRDRSLAISAAERALELSIGRDWRTLDALGAAYANGERFAEAEEVLAEALRGAPAKAKPGLEARLERYRQNRPFRQITSTARVPASELAR